MLIATDELLTPGELAEHLNIHAGSVARTKFVFDEMLRND